MASQNADRNSRNDSDDSHSDMQAKMYLRFAAMILTGMVLSSTGVGVPVRSRARWLLEGFWW